MTRRGVTLLELLLAIGLFLAMTALVLPPVMGGLRARAFESGAESVRQQLLLARAQAQATGRPVEVVYEPGPRRVTARYFAIEDGGDTGEPAAFEEVRAPPRAPPPPPPEEDGADQAIVESWAELRLANGVRLTATADPDDGGAPGDAGDAGDGIEPLRLAVFMPDGSALLRRTVWIVDDHGRRDRCAVNSWTGLPSVAPDVEPPEPRDDLPEVRP